MATSSIQRQQGLNGLDAGMSVLESFERLGCALTLGDISAKLGLSKSRVFRILSTLKRRGFVEQSSRGGPYRLGPRLATLVNAVANLWALPRVAAPVMAELIQTTRGTAVLRILDGDEQLTVDCVHSPEVLRTSFPVGARLPAGYGSTGKALLAYQPERRLVALIGAAAANSRELRTEFARTRLQGYAINLEETTKGVRSVAAPILERDGIAVAALGVSFPSFALPRRRIPEVAREVVAACARIGARFEPSEEPAETGKRSMAQRRRQA